MAKQRCLPTSFFKDPDVMALSSGDVRLILIGLVLNADDEGRGLAHTRILGRELDYSSEVIESALQEMEACELVQCYQVERHRYYSLRRWGEWQTLSKPTSSKFPPPPTLPSAEAFPAGPEHSEISQEISGKPGEVPPEGEGERETEPKGREEEGEGLSNVLSFPATRTGTTSVQAIEQATREVAQILKLTINPALMRIVEEYLGDPLLSLLGEADAAREYIDDKRRNRNGQRMTPAFFRRWLKRERDDALQRRARRMQSTGIAGQGSVRESPGDSSPGHGGTGDPARNLMNLREQYAAEMSEQVAPIAKPAQERH